MFCSGLISLFKDYTMMSGVLTHTLQIEILTVYSEIYNAKDKWMKIKLCEFFLD